MSESVLVQETRAVGCRSAGGTYNLPKSFIAFDVYFDGVNVFMTVPPEYVPVDAPKTPLPGAANRVLQGDAGYVGIAVIPKPDAERTYCLDYLGAATSNDTFIVKRTNSLLDQITTSADDKSADIAKLFIQTAFDGISGNADFTNFRSAGAGSLGTTLKFSGAFDPFDHHAVAEVNNTIKNYGLCLFLDGEPINPLADDVGTYCENPLAWRQRRDWSAYTKLARRYSERPAEGERILEYAGYDNAPRKFSQGIFYRPRLPYTYYLYVKENLKLKNVRGAWKMRGTATLLLENAAPVLSVGVDRTFFAKRDTTLLFDQGVLKDVKIAKGSEFANFSTIPLQIAQSVAALPAAVVKVKIDKDNSRAQLIDAQAQLIAAQRLYANDVAAYNKVATPIPTPAVASTNQCVSACVSSGQPEAACQASCGTASKQ